MRRDQVAASHASAETGSAVSPANANDRQRVVAAFESFHQLLAGGSGSLPRIRYSSAPPVPRSAIDVEVRINDVRSYIQVDFTEQFIWLNGITVNK